MKRQELLRRADAPVVQIVLDEATILRLVGMPQLMADQLSRLRLAGQMSNISLQVLPLAAGTQECASGSFMIFGFPHEADRDLIFVELPTGQLYLDGEDHILRYTRPFERLQAAALDTVESAALIAARAPA
jgi:Domain of unknown function (DUF5753)